MSTDEKKMTALRFAQDYAARSGVDLATLAEHNQVVCSCDDPDCDHPTCVGWVMESENYINNCKAGNIPLPDEMYPVKDME